jgi:hypothetical protein
LNFCAKNAPHRQLVTVSGKHFSNYFTIGLKRAADHPQLRQARSFSVILKRHYDNE